MYIDIDFKKITNGPLREKFCLCHLLFGKLSIISKLATSEISIFLLVFVSEKTGLNLELSETPKMGFVALMPIYVDYVNYFRHHF